MREAIPLRRQRTNIRQLLTSTLEILRRQAVNLDIEFRIDASNDIPIDAPIDPEKIAWAVATLVGNALRYVRPGTRLMPGGSIHLKLGYTQETKELTVAVQDDGPGIPQSKVPWLFQRSPGEMHAAGLGLMLVNDVVVAHGGRVEVESRTTGFDHGTAITLRLPIGTDTEETG